MPKFGRTGISSSKSAASEPRCESKAQRVFGESNWVERPDPLQRVASGVTQFFVLRQLTGKPVSTASDSGDGAARARWATQPPLPMDGPLMGS
mmetsp:Transcript_90021/g.178996  ORF Transcript_90021/g.178996 Transcript_90021/m.178996 type:complete len:93 (-) Transcript_90021:331-609(-)